MGLLGREPGTAGVAVEGAVNVACCAAACVAGVVAVGVR